MENITPPEDEPIDEPIEEFEFETTTRAEYIHCACEAYNTTAESNPMTKEDTRIVEAFLNNSLQLQKLRHLPNHK